MNNKRINNIELNSSKKLFENTGLWKSLMIVIFLAICSSLITGLYVFVDQVLMLKILPINTSDFNNTLLSEMNWYDLISKINSGIVIDSENIMDGYMTESDVITSIVRVVNSSLSPIILLCTAISLMIGLGTSIPYSKALGKKESSEIKKILSNGVFNAALLGIISTFLLIGLTYVVISAQINQVIPNNIDENIKHFLNIKNQKTIDFAIQYSLIICGFNILNIASTFLASMLNSEGKNYVPAFVLIFANVINIVLDFVLLYFTNLGISGSAIATIISYVISNVFFVFFIWKKSEQNETFLNISNISFKRGTIDIKLILMIVAVGSASFLRSGSVALFSFTQQSIYSNITHDVTGLLPNYYIDVLGAVTPIYNLFFSGIIGVLRGARTVISYNHGIGNSKRLVNAFWISNCLTIIYASIFFIFACVITTSIPGANGGFLWFFDITPNSPLYDDAIKLLNINMGQLIIYSLSMSGMLYFQSTQKSFRAAISSIMNGLIVGLPVLLITSLVAKSTHNITIFNFSSLISTTISGVIVFGYSVWFIYRHEVLKNENN